MILAANPFLDAKKCYTWASNVISIRTEFLLGTRTSSQSSTSSGVGCRRGRQVVARHVVLQAQVELAVGDSGRGAELDASVHIGVDGAAIAWRSWPGEEDS